MKVYLEGEAIRAICETCNSRQEATFRYDSIKMEDGLVIDGVMQAFCNNCGSSLVIAPQSTPKIRQARTKVSKKTSFRLPRILADIASCVVAKAGARYVDRAPEFLYKASLSSLLDEDPQQLEKLSQKLIAVKSNELLKLPGNHKVTVSLNPVLYEKAKLLQEATQCSQSELFRVILVAAGAEPGLDSPKYLRRSVALLDSAPPRKTPRRSRKASVLEKVSS
ncbi:hypothetical protein IV102_30825 [bacterium]|nr:hypothetical protein [bacterium]